jgi:predicted RNA-binding protein YlxR (DUF448 family)
LVKGRHTPQRSCVACGQKHAKKTLVRIVRTPQGAVTVDLTGKSPGRGAYLCRAPACWDRGMKKGVLERSLKLTLSTQDKAGLVSLYQETVVGQPNEGL